MDDYRYRFDDADEDAHRHTASLGGVAITLLLVVLGLLLVRELRSESTLEDCLLTGRTNCVVIAAP
jgi:hypothetical protein